MLSSLHFLHMEVIMERRNFLKYSFVAVGAFAASIIAPAKLDFSKGFETFQKSSSKLGPSEAYAVCGSSYDCSGGGGMCGSSYDCSGGGGVCGSSYDCSGGGAVCGSSYNCSGGGGVCGSSYGCSGS